MDKLDKIIELKIQALTNPVFVTIMDQINYSNPVEVINDFKFLNSVALRKKYGFEFFEDLNKFSLEDESAFRRYIDQTSFLMSDLIFEYFDEPVFHRSDDITLENLREYINDCNFKVNHLNDLTDDQLLDLSLNYFDKCGNTIDFIKNNEHHLCMYDYLLNPYFKEFELNSFIDNLFCKIHDQYLDGYIGEREKIEYMRNCINELAH